MFVPNEDILSFSILSSCYIEDLVVLDIRNKLISVFENLPPIAVGAPYLQVVLLA